MINTRDMKLTASYLWIYGPLSIAELAKRLGQDRLSVYTRVAMLRRDGLAARIGRGQYVLTVTGRASLRRLWKREKQQMTLFANQEQ